MYRGFFITLQAMRRKLAAKPCDLYRFTPEGPFPGEQVWSACNSRVAPWNISNHFIFPRAFTL
jgi:hypothetical protein